MTRYNHSVSFVCLLRQCHTEFHGVRQPDSLGHMLRICATSSQYDPVHHNSPNQGQSYTVYIICVHTHYSLWKLCLLVCKMLFLQKFLLWGKYDITAALARKWHSVSDAMCSEFDWQVLFCSISWFGEHKKQSIKERKREAQSSAQLWSVRLQHCSFTWQLPKLGLDICHSHPPRSQ